jgi:dihydrofolate reductase
LRPRAAQEISVYFFAPRAGEECAVFVPSWQKFLFFLNQQQDQLMPIISAIAAIARNGVIGKDNGIPWHIPEDFRYFKRMTLGKPVFMGRKCYESLGKPLPGRLNIVITSKPDKIREQATALYRDMEGAAPASADTKTGLIVVGTIEDAIAEAKKTGAPEIMNIGGAQIYAAAMKYAQRLYLTRIERDYDGDTFFPAFDEKEWKLASDERHEGNPPYSFTVLERINRI